MTRKGSRGTLGDSIKGTFEDDRKGFAVATEKAGYFSDLMFYAFVACCFWCLV